MAKIWHDSEARKNFENVFNENTLKALYHLTDRGYFDVLHGIVSDGKEARVCVAEKGNDFIAVKIYTVEASNYRNLQRYLLGDPRFRGIKRNRRSIIHNWCKKEFKNLKKAETLGIPAPRPHAFRKNVLLMDFLGEDFRPAPRLQDVEIDDPAPVLDDIIMMMTRLYREESLVHGDLSPFNILWWQGGPYLIDFSQAVLKAHSLSQELLERDVENVLQHFRKRYGIDRDTTETVDRIRGEDGA